MENMMLSPASKNTQEPPLSGLQPLGDTGAANIAIDRLHDADAAVSRRLYVSLHEIAHHGIRGAADVMGQTILPPHPVSAGMIDALSSEAVYSTAMPTLVLSTESYRFRGDYRERSYLYDKIVKAIDGLNAPSVRRKVVLKLNALKKSVSSPGWDGEGAESVAEGTFRLARAFLNQLPADVADPQDVDATPQGELEFSWEGANGAFSVLVLPSGELAMSGIYGRMRLYGNAEWDRQSLPGFVSCGLAWVGSPTRK